MDSNFKNQLEDIILNGLIDENRFLFGKLIKMDYSWKTLIKIDFFLHLIY